MSEPDKNRVCSLNYLDPITGEPISCRTPSTVRVSRFSERDYLQDDGTWKKEISKEQYLCEKHFGHLYLQHPFYWRIYNQNKEITDENGKRLGQFDTELELGDWTYTRFESDIKEVETR